MKYRRLTIDELKELEREFHLFLSAHSIPAMEWQKMKSNNAEKAEELIQKFSDFIFDNVLDKVEFLEYRDEHQIQIADVRNDPFQMRGIRVIGNIKINFKEDQSPEMIKALLMKHGGKMQLISGDKKLENEPNLHKFNLMQKGFLISKDPDLYNTIKSMQEEE
jgi:RNA-binding protein YhbY